MNKVISTKKQYKAPVMLQVVLMETEFLDITSPGGNLDPGYDEAHRRQYYDDFEDDEQEEIW